MRANELERQFIRAIIQSRMFKRKRGRWYIGSDELESFLDQTIFNPSIDTPEVRKIRGLIVQLGECPNARPGWRRFVEKYKDDAIFRSSCLD